MVTEDQLYSLTNDDLINKIRSGNKERDESHKKYRELTSLLEALHVELKRRLGD